MGRFPPNQIGNFSKGEAPRNAMVKPCAVFQAIEALWRAGIFFNEGTIPLVNIGCNQLGRFRIGAGNGDRGHAHHVGGQACGNEVTFMGGCRDQHFTAKMAAFFLGCQLIFKMHTSRTCLNIGLHDLVGIQRATKASFRIGHNRQEPIALGATFRMLHFIRALQGAVDAAAKLRACIGRVKRLIRIHCAGRIGISGHLPARKIDRF